MTILRSVGQEKSNRIIEIILGSVSPQKLMGGKILGIGLTAIIQLLIWFLLIALGLYFMREFLFPDSFDMANLVKVQMTEQVKNTALIDQLILEEEQNDVLNLIYERINFGAMNFYFLLFFIAAYLFYGAFFTAIGATAGSENDGQQFVIPLLFILAFAAYAGYYSMQFPESSFSNFLQYFPFTAPIVVLVKLAIGYDAGSTYQIFLSLFILLVSAFFALSVAGRLYKNGILQFGHRIRFSTLVNWLKKM